MNDGLRQLGDLFEGESPPKSSQDVKTEHPDISIDGQTVEEFNREEFSKGAKPEFIETSIGINTVVRMRRTQKGRCLQTTRGRKPGGTNCITLSKEQIMLENIMRDMKVNPSNVSNHIQDTLFYLDEACRKFDLQYPTSQKEFGILLTKMSGGTRQYNHGNVNEPLWAAVFKSNGLVYFDNHNHIAIDDSIRDSTSYEDYSKMISVRTDRKGLKKFKEHIRSAVKKGKIKVKQTTSSAGKGTRLIHFPEGEPAVHRGPKTAIESIIILLVNSHKISPLKGVCVVATIDKLEITFKED